MVQLNDTIYLLLPILISIGITSYIIKPKDKMNGNKIGILKYKIHLLEERTKNLETKCLITRERISSLETNITLINNILEDTTKTKNVDETDSNDDGVVLDDSNDGSNDGSNDDGVVLDDNMENAHHNDHNEAPTDNNEEATPNTSWW